METEQHRSPAQLWAGVLSIGIVIGASVAAIHSFVSPRAEPMITLSPEEAIPNPFAGLLNMQSSESSLKATLIPMHTPDAGLHVYYGDFNGTDTEKVMLNAVSLMRVPDDGQTVPAKAAITSASGATNPPDYFGYRYTRGLAERKRSLTQLPFRDRFPGEFYYSTLAYLRHKEAFDKFAEENQIVWFLDKDILQMPGRLHLVAPGENPVALAMRVRNFPQVCGDGAVIGSEQCDDASTANGDGCSETCTVEATWACTGQPSRCYQPSLCGNGVKEALEECDDSNALSGDGCSESCRKEFCGDGVFQPALGEQCDGTAEGNQICNWDCTLIVPF